MKGLLAVLLAALSFSANADSWAMPNQAGGEIVLTDRKCPGYKNLLQAYNYSNTGKSETGCWTIVDDMVHVVWDRNGSRYTYPLDSFYTKSTSKKGQGV
jgi:hypothetical protein